MNLFTNVRQIKCSRQTRWLSTLFMNFVSSYPAAFASSTPMPPTIHVSHRIESYPGLHQLLCSLRSREFACTNAFSGHSAFLAIARPSPYSARDVEDTLADMALAELD